MKNGQPYALKLSGKIMGIHEENGRVFTTQSSAAGGSGRVTSTYELLYDAAAQEFTMGAKV